MMGTFKLEKLKIYVLTKNAEGKAEPQQSPFEVMFNPESYSMKYVSERQQDSRGNPTNKWYRNNPTELELKLIFDGTPQPDSHWTGFGLPQITSVARKVDEFLDTCYDVVEGISEPNDLRITWGKWPARTTSLSNGFDCKLKSVDIKYTSFDRDGSPLRAELSTVFVDVSEVDVQAQRAARPGKKHTVKAGDKLEALCKNEYKKDGLKDRVAAFNGLDSNQELSPGQELLLPPENELPSVNELSSQLPPLSIGPSIGPF